jgi:TolB-like protein/DNA-binding winged helix-turn-helix (wHTH) protein/TolA-binding protein
MPYLVTRFVCYTPSVEAPLGRCRLMASTPSQPQLLRFGVFELDVRTGELRKSGIRLKLGKQSFEVLHALLERPGELVSREELRSRLWPADTIVDFDLALKKSVNRLRGLIGDSADSPRFIETIPRRGYRFIYSITTPVSLTLVPAPPSETAVPRVIEASKSQQPFHAAPDAMRRAVNAVLIIVGIATLLFSLNVRNVRGRIFVKSRPAETIRSIAVLPLVNLSSDPEQQYFSDGMTDELITNLAKIRGLRVISHTSVERYKKNTQTLPDVARQLGVDAVVEGTIMHSGNRVRITAQLIDGRLDRHIWAESYERDIQDSLELQAEVAQSIARKVGISLSVDEQAELRSNRTVDSAVQEAYLRGKYYANQLNCTGFKKALDYFQQAAAKDSQFAPAYSGMAESYFTLADWYCWPQENAFANSQAAALKAIELDPTLPSPHASLGELAFYHDWDWAKAGLEYKRAIELGPNHAETHSSYAIYLIAMGRQDEGLREMKIAHELDPVSEFMNMQSTYAFYLTHQFDRAIDQGNRTLELYPSSTATYYWLGQTYERKGSPEQAASFYLKAPPGPVTKLVEDNRKAYRQSGLRGFWLHQLAKERDTSAPRPCAEIFDYAHLGDKERTLQSLQWGYQHHCDGLQFLKVEPLYDDLRGDSRFEDLIAHLGL